eukprot:1157652-Pelagomonas_calceolata.AAC.11
MHVMKCKVACTSKLSGACTRTHLSKCSLLGRDERPVLHDFDYTPSLDQTLSETREAPEDARTLRAIGRQAWTKVLPPSVLVNKSSIAVKGAHAWCHRALESLHAGNNAERQCCVIRLH